MKNFNVILFCDTPMHATKTRGYGTHRLATHIRDNGYTCLVIDFISVLDFKTYETILFNSIGRDTLMVGFSTTFMPMRVFDDLPSTEVPGFTRRETDDQRFSETSVFNNCLINEFTLNRPKPWLELIKKINPNTKIVFGGSNIGFYIDDVFSDYVDNYILGYAETMIIDYLNSISNKDNKKIFNKIIDYDYKAQNPSWDFRLSTTKYTEFDFIKSNETLSIEVGRGCRFKCRFCSYPLIGQKNTVDYIKFKEILRSEFIENYKSWGITKYFIVDDTFNDSTEKLLMVRDVVASLPFKISFWCFLRLELLANDPTQISLLKEMGINQTYIGIETFNTKAGRIIGKGMNSEKQKETLKLCRDIWGKHVHIQAGFMVGLPYENEDSIAETAKYLCEPDCPIDEAWIFPLNIFNSNQNNLSAKYIYKSEFDLNFKQYGYYFEEHSTEYLQTNWIKNDGTNINTYKEAMQIASKWNNKVTKKIFNMDFYKSSLDHLILSDRETTGNMTQKEYTDLLESIDLEQLFYNTVVDQYFIPLTEKLKN